MAKVVIFTKEIIRGIVIQNFMTGGKEIQETELWENDVVEGFRFAANKEVKSVSGRLSNIAFAAKSNKANKPFASNVSVASIDIDCSENYVSDIYTIPESCILEYGADASVDDVKVKPMVKLKLTCILSDQTEKSLEIEEGTKFFDVLFYPKSGNPVHGDFEIKNFIYTINAKKFDITGFNVSDGTNTYAISIDQIKSFGKSGVVVTDPSEFAAALEAIAAGTSGGAVLPNGLTISDPITFASSAKVSGPGITPINEILEGEAVLSGNLTVSAGADVSVFGAVITGDGFVVGNDPASLEFDHCKFIGLTGEATKLYAVRGTGLETSTNETRLVVKDCFFGDNADNMYNFFELATKLGNSEVSGCYFTKKACNHNIINIYEMADGATFNITGNHFEYSANAVRVGCVGAPERVKININNNIYDETDTNDPDWAGLFFVQPYKTKTTSMAGITITAKNNKGPKNTQLYYVYCGGDDTQLDETTLPKIVV